MKALPLWQPYASLVAMSAKRIETRHWRAPDYLIGQRIAIHACLNRTDLHLAGEYPFSAHLPEADALPLGAILCTVMLKRCAPITEEGAARLERDNPDEYAFGNYDLTERQRYAWVLTDVDRFDEPVPFTGSQGVFNVPDDLAGEMAQGRLL